MTAVPHIAHITTPLATDSSTIAHVVRALTREHAAAGGRSTVVVSHNRAATFPDADVVAVDYTRHCPKQYFTRREYLADAALGAVLAERPHGGRIFAPAVEAFAAEPPDWVLLHEGQYAVAALPRLRRALPASTGVALHVHNAISRACLRPELSWLLRHADLVLTVSDFVGAEVRRRAWVRADAVRTLYNGVSTDVFTAAEGPTVAEGDRLRLLFVGQVAPHKGVHTLLEGLQRLGREAARFELRVVGSGEHRVGAPITPYERDLRRFADGAGVLVDFRPHADQAALVEHYRWADAVCVPSVAEPFGLVPLEAMACGALVMANRAGALPEVVGDVGVLVQPNPAGWAAALAALTPEPSSRGREDRLARARRFTWAATYANLRGALEAASFRR